MSKAIEGAAMLGGAVLDGAAMFLMASTGVGLAALPFMGELMATMVAGGVAMEAGAIAGALTSNRGMDITTRQAAAARQIIYGMQRVGGVMVYQNTTGSSKNQYNMVIVVAGHPVTGFSELYLDGRKVIWQAANPAHPDPSYLPSPGGIYFGGPAAGGRYEGPDGQQYSFNALVFARGYYGQQTAAGGADASLEANDPQWAVTASGTPYLGGCSWFYLKCEYDPGTFPQRPETRITVMGKPVYDPRTGTTAYSANAALVCADWITDAEYGLGMQVNQAQLIAAANICDEQVPLANQPNQPGGITTGLTEDRYQCHFHFDTSTAPTDALATMLKSMGGRISLIGGEVYLWPAAWIGSSAAFDESALTSGVSWDPTAEYKSAVNQVRGTYMAPNYPYNIAGNLYDKNGFAPDGTLLDTWQFGFTPASIPPYAQDPLHGYAANQWLNEDSGVTAAWATGTAFTLGQVVSYVTPVSIGTSGTTVPYYQIYKSLIAGNLNNTPSPTSTYWQLAPVNLRMDANYNMVLSIAQAQRLAKIDLMRARFWGRGRLEMGLAAFALQECDVMSFTFPAHSWVAKPLEILGCTLSVKMQDGQPGELGSPPEVRVLFDVGETDPSIYTWSVTEELSIYDVPLSQMGQSSIVAPPTAVTAVSDSSTAIVGVDGILTPQIKVMWDTPQDPFATKIDCQYQLAGASTWRDAGTVSVELNEAFLGPIVAGQSYNVQICAVRPNGASSVWVAVTITAGVVLSIVTQSGFGIGSLIGEAFSDGTAAIVCNPFTTYIGSISLPILPGGAVTLTGLTQQTQYYVYYVDPSYIGGNVTPIATKLTSDFVGKPGYFLIDTIVTPYAGTGGVGSGLVYPTSFSDSGSRTTGFPGYAYDGNLDTSANVSGAFTQGVTHSTDRFSFGTGTWGGFSGSSTSARTLTVIASATLTVGGTGTLGSATITANVVGASTLLVTFSATTAKTTYTLNLPAGTDFSTVSVQVDAEPGSGLATGDTSSTAVAVFEMYIG